ncbi:unnamed protein product [Calypogeia fissa]
MLSSHFNRSPLVVMNCKIFLVVSFVLLCFAISSTRSELTCVIINGSTQMANFDIRWAVTALPLANVSDQEGHFHVPQNGTFTLPRNETFTWTWFSAQFCFHNTDKRNATSVSLDAIGSGIQDIDTTCCSVDKYSCGGGSLTLANSTTLAVVPANTTCPGSRPT